MDPSSIKYVRQPAGHQDCKFSVLIPTWNNLEMLKICIKAIKEHSRFNHQIILHINESADGTLEWAKSQGIDYSFSTQNIGVCYGMNAAASLARTDYIAYLNDDMYVLPDWDYYLWQEIESRKDDLFFLSATAIEPHKTSSNFCSIAPYSYGTDAHTFQEEKLLKEFASLEKGDWAGATWPPNVLSKRMWDLVGGYSIEFSPGMYSDPDFSMKLWQAGVRYFKGVAKSRVYHFMSKSTGRIVKNDGSKTFLLKWSMTSSTFVKLYIQRGAEFKGELNEPKRNLKLLILKVKARIKIMFNLS